MQWLWHSVFSKRAGNCNNSWRVPLTIGYIKQTYRVFKCLNYSKLQPEHGVWRGACGHCVVQQVVPDLSKWWPAGWNWRRQPCVAILVAWQSLDLDQLSAANVLFSFFVLLRPGSACWPLLGCLSKAWTYIYTGPCPKALTECSPLFFVLFLYVFFRNRSKKWTYWVDMPDINLCNWAERFNLTTSR